MSEYVAFENLIRYIDSSLTAAKANEDKSYVAWLSVEPDTEVEKQAESEYDSACAVTGTLRELSRFAHMLRDRVDR